MKLLYILCLSIFTTMVSYSQAPKIGQLKGNIVDIEEKQPISYATITLKQVADSVLVTGGLSVENGSFLIEEIPFGEFLIEVSFIGYDTKYYGPLSFNREKYIHDIGALELGIDSNALEGVIVETDAPAVRYEVDKKVYDASKIKAAEGGTAKDVLEQIPSVTLSSDQSIQLRGSGDVRVLINGRPSNFSMNTILEQIPQKNIKEIEIITNPSAKYDAEGEVGIINIILKNNELQGLTGGINTSWGTENKWNLGGNIAYKINKWNLSTSYNYNRFRDNFFRYNQRQLVSEPDINQIGNDQRNFARAGHFVRLGADYYLDDNNTIFLSGSYNIGDRVSDSELDAQDMFTQLFNGTENIPADYYTYNRLNDSNEDRDGYNVNASFQHLFNGDQRHNILFDINYSDGNEDEINQYSIAQFISESNTLSGFNDSDRNIEDSDNFQLSIDYTNPFDSKQKLELGYRSTLENRNESFLVTYNNIPYEPSSGTFDFSQDIHAGYATYEKQVNDKLGIKGGLRAEYTDVSSIAEGGNEATYEDQYLSFFPSASASYKVTDKLQLTASYSRRVSRPRGRRLNPFANRADQNNIFVGNNQLRPQFTDSYELNFNQFWDVVSVDGSLYHRNLTDQIQYVTTFDESLNVNVVTFENLSQQKVYGSELTFDIKPKSIKWYSLRLSGSYNYSKVTQNDDNININNSEFTLFNTNIRNDFRFPSGWSGQLAANYQSPFQGYIGDLQAMWGINTSVSKQILDNKGNVFIRANDLFNTFGLNVDIEDEFRTQQVELDWPSQMAFIGFNYNFGNLKQQKRRKMQRREERGDDGPQIGL